jgi:dienelactone hydrolase
MKKSYSIIQALLLLSSVSVFAKESTPSPEWWQKGLLPAKRQMVSTNGLKAVFYTPAKGTGPWQPVVMLSGSQGGMIGGKRINRLIASGYCVITPEYLGKGEELISVPLEFFDNTLDWLQNNPCVTQGGVAVVGGSKGGELALVLASRKKEIKAMVGLVPSSHVFKGIAKRPHRKSSWSYEGKDIPYLPYSNWKATYAFFSKGTFLNTYQSAWDKRDKYPKSRIPCEQSHAAILLLSGKNDTMWPSSLMCNEIINQLNECAYPFPLEHVAYDCGHEVGSKKEHWIKITDFLRKHYK